MLNQVEVKRAGPDGQKSGRPQTPALHGTEVGRLFHAGVSKAEIARRLGYTQVCRKDALRFATAQLTLYDTASSADDF